MSKRTELKFKKMLKKADFVHADLEYHEELVHEAKTDFNEAFVEKINSMSRLERRHWKRHVKQLSDERAKKLLEEAQKDKEKVDQEAEEDTGCTVGPANKETFIDGATGEERYLNPEEIEETDVEDKQGVIKKLYRRIANETHPDKLIAAGAGPLEVNKKTKLFKKAKEAYERDNWYTIYSIATDLGITPGDISEKQIAWIEEDIKLTMGRISSIGRLFVWVWYVAEEEQREEILKQYFKQVYDYNV
jgi:DnaJ-domain-containing protein 1